MADIALTSFSTEKAPLLCHSRPELGLVYSIKALDRTVADMWMYWQSKLKEVHAKHTYSVEPNRVV